VVVGIISYNDADTVGDVVRRVSAGIAAHAPQGCLVLSDGGSTDGTVKRAESAAADVCPLVTVDYSRPALDPLAAPYHGWYGRAAAILSVLRAASARAAAACAVIDARLTSVSPEWMPSLLEPVLSEEFDYVAPYYERHPYEGAITKSVIAPMFRALYGVRLRQPAGGEFGCSSRLLQHLLDQTYWTAKDADSGIDIWMASAAAVGGFRVCEAALGGRTHVVREDPPDVSTALAQVVGGMFADVEARAETWQRIRGSQTLPVFGRSRAEMTRPPVVDVEPMLDRFRLGFEALHDVWAWIVAPRTLLQLRALAEAPAPQFRFGNELWTQVVYDFALAYRARSMPHDHLLGALTPLYLGWLASFVEETRRAGDVEDRLAGLGEVFEMKKPYLIAGWRWPERFRV
jgi:glucosylglycerate synthase